MNQENEKTVEQVVIIGSGPAGHTAAIYAARANLNPCMLEGDLAGGVAAGGQLTTTTEVENFPGFPAGIMGPKLMADMREQSLKHGARIFTDTVDRVDLSQRPFRVFTLEKEILTQSLIIATGATAKRLGIPGEQTFWNAGISACAVCDGALPMFRGQQLVVVGGGDTAAEESLYLTKFAQKVTIVHRRGELRASKVMQERLLSHPKIAFLWNHVVKEAKGQSGLESIIVEDIKTGRTQQIEAKGLFYAIGHQPNTEFLQGQLALNEAGYIVTSPGTTETSVEGVFAAGDVQDPRWRQVVTAAGSGCIAALQAEHFLSTH